MGKWGLFQRDGGAILACNDSIQATETRVFVGAPKSRRIIRVQNELGAA
jgi:hypothetical protein